MDRKARSREDQHRGRISRRTKSTETMDFFNVLTSAQMLEATEALSPEHRERLYRKRSMILSITHKFRAQQFGRRAPYPPSGPFRAR